MRSPPIIALLAVLQAAAAQDSNPRDADLLGLVDRSEKLLASGSAERATRLLIVAERALLAESPGVLRDSLRATILGLAEKADPNRKVRMDTFARAAGELIKTSRMYGRRGWHSIASRLLEDAAELSPERVAKERSKAARTGSASRFGRKKTPSGPEDLLSRFKASDANGWDVRRDEIRSPPPTKTGSAVLVGPVKVENDRMVSIEVKRPNTASLAAILFGAIDYDDYFIFDVDFRTGTECAVTVYHWKAPRLKELGVAFFHIPKARRGDWLRYAVRIEGKKVTCFVGKKSRITVMCDREPYGSIGMHVSGASPYRGAVAYRRLRVYKPKRSTGGGAPDTKPLIANISRAEGLIRERKNEAATLLLLDAEHDVAALANATLQKTLGQTVAKLIRRADRTIARYKGSRVAAAVALVGLAETYANAKWYFLAGDILTHAERLDRSSAAALRLTVDERTKAVVAKPASRLPDAAATKDPVGAGAKPRGLAAEPQVATHNLDLLMWFEGGRQPYDKDAWRVSTEGVAAPVDRLGRTLILSTGDFEHKTTFSVQVKTTDKECCAGVAFGFKTTQSYHYVAWRHAAKGGLTYVQVYQVKGSETKRIGPAKTFRFSAEARRSWMTARVVCGDKFVRFRLGNAPEFKVAIDASNFAGKIGLHATVLDSKQPVHFRNLVIEDD
jgi:hypothetical protein